MIKIEKNTLQQEVWFPRMERGENTFRKTYQDGFDDGYQDGLASQKIKLYDGMGLAGSDIYGLDAFDFSDVKTGSNVFRECTFYNDFYDFTPYSFITDGTDTDYLFSEISLNKPTKMIIRIPKIISYKTFYIVRGETESTLFCYLNRKVEEMREWFIYNYAFKRIELYGDFSQCTVFKDFFGWADSADNREINFHHFDMSSEENTTENVFKSSRKGNTIRMDDTSPRSSIERLLDDATRYNHLDWTYYYGKERWTYDTSSKEWVLSGYDD